MCKKVARVGATRPREQWGDKAPDGAGHEVLFYFCFVLFLFSRIVCVIVTGGFRIYGKVDDDGARSILLYKPSSYRLRYFENRKQ